MDDSHLSHTRLESIIDYIEALDQLCKNARQDLYLFEKDFDGLGFNSEARFSTLRSLLLSRQSNRLFFLAHDVKFLSTRCPRMMMLLNQFGTSMFVYQTPMHLRYVSEPFAVADNEYFVRRFHFDDTRGIKGEHDPQQACLLKSRFIEMWKVSKPSPDTNFLKL